jgi:hypothetical protein
MGLPFQGFSAKSWTLNPNHVTHGRSTDTWHRARELALGFSYELLNRNLNHATYGCSADRGHASLPKDLAASPLTLNPSIATTGRSADTGASPYTVCAYRDHYTLSLILFPAGRLMFDFFP